MEESSSTDKDSTLQSSQPQLSYNYHNVAHIANEWNTSSSSPEDETYVKTLFQQNVSKQLKWRRQYLKPPKHVPLQQLEICTSPSFTSKW